MSRRRHLVMVRQCMGGWCQAREVCGAYHAPFRGTPADRRVCPPGQDLPFPMGVKAVVIQAPHRVPVGLRRVSGEGFAAKVSGKVSGASA